MSEATLKIFRAPGRCTCPKCSAAPKVAPKYTLADYAKAIAALVTAGKMKFDDEVPAPPDFNARIRERRDVVVPPATTPREANGVPNPPDLNEAIRRAAKEVK